MFLNNPYLKEEITMEFKMLYWNNNESVTHVAERMPLIPHLEGKSVSSNYPSQDV